ncbi:MAG: RIP metalloprotease RseP [Elusimicrobia bacterium RIFOXYD12_FULL_66_9]|nr:MAG: RIP metalloprotease RseP [Elusimicrobia bacterium RIFOXYD12_FULL_66_9]
MIFSALHTVVANAIALGMVIFLHEFGHYLACRKLGVRVERFAFGFGTELLGFTGREGTRFSLCAIPFGGFVKPAGEDPVEGGPEPKPDEYFGQSWNRRLIIVYAGPAMNYVLAFCLYTGLIWGRGLPEPTKAAVIGNIVIGFPADKAGIQIGDRVLSFDGRSLTGWEDLASSIHRSAGKEVLLGIERESKPLDLKVTPRKDEAGEKGLIGIMPKAEYRPVGPFGAMYEATRLCWLQTQQTVTTIAGKIWKRERPDLAGPVGIFQMVARAARSGWEDFIFLIGFISVAIGFFNLLPLPMLDGGHGAFYFWEGIRGHRLSASVQEKANTVGLALLLSLLVFATYNDFLRIRSQRAAKSPKPAAEQRK